MDDLSPSQLKKLVKLEFSRKCGHFQPIIAHMGEDLITRYSNKAQPHPEFFKQDASMVHKQLILYADQCISAMRKFSCMESPASIVSSLLNSLMKVNEYLAKQLYHQLKMQRPESNSLVGDSLLCTCCCKFRQNERVRVLKDELNLNKTDMLSTKIMCQIVTRKREKYDVEQLLQQEHQNLQELNEGQIRKRLGKLQADHDRRRQEMTICIQQLARANQRVAGYCKAIEKKVKEDNNFNIKEYVFQISRHFYHNISSLDQKIKGLKLGLNPALDSQTQTQQDCILLNLHQQITTQNNIQIAQLKSAVHDLHSQLIIENRKCKEQADNCSILQEKLRQSQVYREKSQISQKFTEAQLKGAIDQYQSKTENLEKIVKKLKTTNQLKDVQLIQLYEAQGNRSRTGKVQKKSELNILCDQNDGLEIKQPQQRKPLKRCLTFNTTLLHSSTLNPRLVQKISSIKDQGIEKLSDVNYLMRSIHKIYAEINQQNKDRLKIQHIFGQSISFQISREYSTNDKPGRERVSLYNVQCKNICSSIEEKSPILKNPQKGRTSQNQTMTKFNKKGIKKIQLKTTQLQKITAIKPKEKLIYQQAQKLNCLKNIETEGKKISLYDTQKIQLQLKKKVDQIKRKVGYFQQKSQATEEHKVLRRQLGGIEFQKKKVRKRRHLSQQNSFDQKDQIENFRRSIDKIITKDTNIFSEQDTTALFCLKNSYLELKSTKKGIFYKPESHKTVLSLQQINYSTYFYSLIAKLHVKNPVAYVKLKRLLSVIPGQGNQEEGVKNSLNALISNHRRCKGGGSICSHLQHFLEKVKNL